VFGQQFFANVLIVRM